MDTDGFVGAHRPIHAFYVTESLPIAAPSSVTKTKSPAFTSHSLTRKVQASHIVTTSTTAAQSTRSSSITSSSTPLIAILPNTPPFIQQQPTVISHHRQHIHYSDRTNDRHHSWLALLLGILGLLGIIGIGILFFICKRRRRHRRCHDRGDKQLVEKGLPASHESWSSLSTIQTSIMDGDKIKSSESSIPPAYYYSKAQKRLTADTLVEETPVLMLNNQYSPQLALSPSLVAGEFQQEEQEQPPMPHMISPSNTLIDNAGILSEEKRIVDGRRRIEIYEPQVNLQHDGSYDTPYSYSNDQEKKS